jgi:hypothetical protein
VPNTRPISQLPTCTDRQQPAYAPANPKKKQMRRHHKPQSPSATLARSRVRRRRLRAARGGSSGLRAKRGGGSWRRIGLRRPLPGLGMAAAAGGHYKLPQLDFFSSYATVVSHWETAKLQCEPQFKIVFPYKSKSHSSKIPS